MKRAVFLFVAVFLILGGVLFGAQAYRVTAEDVSKILEFDTMIGVPRPYTGATNAIRGVPGGGLPWVVGEANGELKINGEIEIDVKGLVLDPTDPVVIERGLAGTNPSPNFKAIVSCLSKDGSGNAVTVNVETGLFPANAQGDSEIEGTVSLPSPCIAPIVFVTSPTGSWFAATGN